MRFASIAERELRVGARNPLTHRVRWLATLAFFGFAAWLFWVTDAGNRRGAGPQYMSALSYLGLLYVLLMGAVRASDALSAERREGTLGLLFLTPLRGVDILAGKLCSHGLGSLYAMVAVMPILALPLLLGGVDGGRVFRVMLAWLSGLVLALVVGLAASVMCVRHAKSAPLAFFGVLAIALIPLGIAELLSFNHFSLRWATGAALISPYTALAFADPGYRPGGLDWFYHSMATILGFSSLLLLWIGWRLSWTWRDAPASVWQLPTMPGLRRRHSPLNRPAHGLVEASSGSRPTLAHEQRRPGVSRRRARLGHADPFAWWASRGSTLSLVTLLLMAALVLVNVYLAVPFAVAQFGPRVLSGTPGHIVCWLICTAVLHVITLYAAGVAASSRVADDRRTGALELLLVVPGAFAGILKGLRAAYERAVLGPAALATLAHAHTTWIAAEVLSLELQSEGRPTASAREIVFAVIAGLDTAPLGIPWELRFMLGSLMLSWVPVAICWATMGSLGRWLALRMKHTGLVPLAGMALLCAPPVLVFSLLCILANQMGITRLPEHQVLPTFRWIGIGLVLLNGSILASWAADTFRRRFRTQVTGSSEPGRPSEWWIGLRLAVRRAATITLLLLVIAGSVRLYQRGQSNRRWNLFTANLVSQGGSLTPAPLPPVADDRNFALAPPLRARLDRKDGPAERGSDYFHALLQDNGRFDDATLDHVTVPFMTQLSMDLTGEPGLQFATSQVPATRIDALVAQAYLKLVQPLEAELREVAAEIVRRPMLQGPHAASAHPADALLQRAPQAERIMERWQYILVSRASARITLGQPQPAFDDVLTALRLARALETEPGFYSHGRRHVMLVRALQPVWEACQTHAWTEDQWQALQSDLSNLRLFEQHTNLVMRVTLGQIAQWTGPEHRPSKSIAALLSSEFNTDFAIVLHEVTRAALRRIDVAHRRVMPETSYQDPIRGNMDYRAKSLVLQPMWQGPSAFNLGHVAAWVHHGIAACALERYRLAHGKYPEQLQALVPGYLESIPSDPMRPTSLHYQVASVTNDAPYTLRSAGPNTQIDGKNQASDDWVWSGLAPAGAGNTRSNLPVLTPPR